MAERQTKNQRKGLIQSGTEFAAGVDARFCSRTSMSGSSNAELEGRVDL